MAGLGEVTVFVLGSSLHWPASIPCFLISLLLHLALSAFPLDSVCFRHFELSLNGHSDQEGVHLVTKSV